MSISQPDGRYIRLVNIITSSSGHVPFLPDPMFLDLHLPSTLQYRVSGQFTHVGRGEFVDLSSARVFFEKVGGCKVELQGVIYIDQHQYEKPKNSDEGVGCLPVDRETLRPVRKKSLNGFRSYVKNKALFDKGDMANPTCLR